MNAAVMTLFIAAICVPQATALTIDDFRGKNIVVLINDQERNIQNFPEGWAEANLPGLQRLKANGVTFNKAYTNSVTCSSARASMLTGLMPPQHGVRHKLRYDMTPDRYPQVELSPDIVNWATVAAAAGYNVVYKGKIDAFKGPNSSMATPEDMLPYGFTRWNPPDSGLGVGFGELGGGDSTLAPGSDSDGRYMNSRAANQAEVDQGLEGALQYITEVAPLQQPFFLVVSNVNPHDVIYYNTSTFYSVGYDSSWLEGSIEIPPTAYEELSPTKPAAQPQFNQITNAFLGALTTPELQRNYVNFYGNLIKNSDQYVVDVLDALAPLIDDTLVIKLADHGEMGLSHGLTRQKAFNFYEETINIPLIFSNPVLFPTPRTSDALVSNIDLLPTVADLLGKSNITKFEGISYAPILLGQAASVQDYVVFSMEDYQVGQSSPPYVDQPSHMACIREADWKFCKYYDPSAPVTKVKSEFEMYDLVADPQETTNLAYSGYTRTAFQQAQYARLLQKLTFVQKTRLRPRRVDNAILLNLNITSTTTTQGAKSEIVQKAGTVVGRPVGNGDVTLITKTSPGVSITDITISSGTGIIRGTAKITKRKGTVKFTSGTGTYDHIKGQKLTWSEQEDGTITIGGVAKY